MVIDRMYITYGRTGRTAVPHQAAPFDLIAIARVPHMLSWTDGNYKQEY